jgi:hypothetical protein
MILEADSSLKICSVLVALRPRQPKVGFKLESDRSHHPIGSVLVTLRYPKDPHTCNSPQR